MRPIRDLLERLEKIGYDMNNKIEAIVYLTIVNAVSYFNAHYLEGLGSYIQNHHPDLERMIMEARAKMDALWKVGVNTESRLVEFRTAVENWSRLEIEALRIFVESRGTN